MDCDNDEASVDVVELQVSGRMNERGGTHIIELLLIGMTEVMWGKIHLFNVTVCDTIVSDSRCVRIRMGEQRW